MEANQAGTLGSQGASLLSLSFPLNNVSGLGKYLQVRPHLIFTVTLGGRSCYPQITDEETGLARSGDLLKVKHLVSGQDLTPGLSSGPSASLAPVDPVDVEVQEEGPRAPLVPSLWSLNADPALLVRSPCDGSSVNGAQAELNL